MEGERDHRLDAAQVDLHDRVIIRTVQRSECQICVFSAMRSEGTAHRLVCLPNGGKTARLRCHDINAIAIIHGEIGNAVTEKFHHAVFHGTLLEGRADQGKRHILRSDTRSRLARQVHADYAWIGNVIGLAQELLDQLRTAFSDGKRAVSAIAGVGVRTEEHPPTAGIHLAHIAVDDGLVRGDELAAVALCGGQAEHMVVLVDRAANGAERVVAVRQHIGQRELL